MNSADLIKLFREYRWGQLWNELADKENDSALYLALRACLTVAQWGDYEYGKFLLQNLESTRDPYAIFFKQLGIICLGQNIRIDVYTSPSSKYGLPIWCKNWLYIEYLGRSEQYKLQSKHLERKIKDNNDEEYMYAAILQSLENPYAQIKYIKRVISEKHSRCKLAYLLAIRTGALQINEDIISNLASTKTNDPAYAASIYRLVFIYVRKGLVNEAISGIDKLAKICYLDLPLIFTWLRLCVSHPCGHNSLLARIKYVSEIVPPNQRSLAQIQVYALITHWINADYAAIHAIIKSNHHFIQLQPTANDRNHKIFFQYILKLSIEWQNNKLNYLKKENSGRLYVIGESHSLSPANLYINWLNETVRVTSKFIMGIKMFHLGHDLPNEQKTSFKDYIDSIESDSHILLTIGEIDCRPNEGIWKVLRTRSVDIDELTRRTVSGYVRWLSNIFRNKSFKSVTLQGIPAPGYDLVGNYNPYETEKFLKMIVMVNDLLREEAISRAWFFLDVYSATSNEKGVGNGIWHLDGWHLKPKFYLDADKWLCSSK